MLVSTQAPLTSHQFEAIVFTAADDDRMEKTVTANRSREFGNAFRANL
jgi:hypothetical protein